MRRVQTAQPQPNKPKGGLVSVPSLSEVKTTLTAKASALGWTNNGVAMHFLGYMADIIAQGLYDHAAQFIDAAKQVVYDDDNLLPHTVVSQASTSVPAGNTTFGPYSRTSNGDRLFLVYWSSSDTAGMGIGPDVAGAAGLAAWIQRTAVADQFEVVVANNTAGNKNIEFSVMTIRFP